MILIRISNHAYCGPGLGCTVRADTMLRDQMYFVLQGRNMVYPGPIDPYFLAVILIPEPHFPQNFDP